MLNGSPKREVAHVRTGGFSIIEMMVAIAAGLILIGATLALVVATLNANAVSQATTRLTQELRAVSQMMAKEIRRAGARGAPLSTIGAGGLPSTDPASKKYDPLVVVTVTGTDDECVQFAYQNVANDGTVSTRAVTIGLRSNQVAMGISDDIAAPVACDDIDIVLSSPQVIISDLNFVSIPGGGITQGVALYVEGSLAAGSPEITAVTRRYSETVFMPALVDTDSSI